MFKFKRPLIAATAVFLAGPVGCGAPAEEPAAAVGTSTAALTTTDVRDHNTQVRIPGDLYLGDVTGDGLADWIAVKGDKVFVAGTAFEARGYAYGKASAPVQRVFTGKFRYTDKSQICAITASATLSCYRTSADNRQLQPSWTQPSFIAADEEAIVGDFDGSGLDDVLVYKPSAGTFRMYSWSAGGSLQPTPNCGPCCKMGCAVA